MGYWIVQVQLKSSMEKLIGLLKQLSQQFIRKTCKRYTSIVSYCCSLLTQRSILSIAFYLQRCVNVCVTLYCELAVNAEDKKGIKPPAQATASVCLPSVLLFCGPDICECVRVCCMVLQGVGPLPCESFKVSVHVLNVYAPVWVC